MSQFITDRSYDYFDLGDESDPEGAESSEDEIDIILHGTPEQRRRLRHSHAREQRHRQTGRLSEQTSRQQLRPRDTQQSSSEDEFEKEMNDELNKTVTMLEMSRGSNPSSGLSIEASSQEATAGNRGATSQSSSSKDNISSGGEKGQSKNAPFYNDIYFDSDDDDNFEGAGENRKQRHHARPSNDDLLYDPDMDDEDQRWVDRQRRQHGAGASHSNSRQAAAGRGGKKRTAGAMTGTTRSDAVLDCPACMTTLCIDCQRHDIYPNQFRAMFVMNCKTNFAELLTVPEQAAKRKISKKAKKSKAQASEQQSSDSVPGGGGEGGGSSTDQFHPVMCDECDTVVGVVDKEEVYHFFNVLVGRA